MQGWDKLREQRHKRLIDLGIIDKEWELSPREKGIPAWDSLSDKEKDQQDLRMASYAAMIDCVDQNVGKIITKLKELNQYDNTLILFLHDNGACDAGGTMGKKTGKGTCGTADHLPIMVLGGRRYRILRSENIKSIFMKVAFQRRLLLIGQQV